MERILGPAPLDRLQEPYGACQWKRSDIDRRSIILKFPFILKPRPTMPDVTFAPVRLHHTYSRNTLAELWGYAGYQALARGVVTPRDSKLIILFVTREKQESAEQYEDHLDGSLLHWEGPTDHFAEDRIANSPRSGEEVHLFYRDRHHSDFTYYGRLQPEQITRHTDRPSRFVFRLINVT